MTSGQLRVGAETVMPAGGLVADQLNVGEPPNVWDPLTATSTGAGVTLKSPEALV